MKKSFIRDILLLGIEDAHVTLQGTCKVKVQVRGRGQSSTRYNKDVFFEDIDVHFLNTQRSYLGPIDLFNVVNNILYTVR
jgi:hypothetical protein